MGIRDEIAKRARKGIKGLIKRASDFLEEGDEPKTEAGGDKGTTPPQDNDTTDGQGPDLLQQLAEMTALSNEMVRRLEAEGRGDQARQVVSATMGRSASDIGNMQTIAMATSNAVDQAQEALKKAFQALNDAGNVLTDRAKKLKKQAEALSKSAEQAARDAQAQADEMQRKADELETLFGAPAQQEYDFDSDPVLIGFLPIDEAYKKLNDQWEEMGIGVKRGPDGKPVKNSPFAPRLKVRGNSVGLPVQVPTYALLGEQAFRIWAEDNGFENGVSMQIDGFIKGSRLIR